MGPAACWQRLTAHPPHLRWRRLPPGGADWEVMSRRAGLQASAALALSSTSLRGYSRCTRQSYRRCWIMSDSSEQSDTASQAPSWWLRSVRREMSQEAAWREVQDAGVAAEWRPWADRIELALETLEALGTRQQMQQAVAHMTADDEVRLSYALLHWISAGVHCMARRSGINPLGARPGDYPAGRP